MLKIFLWHLKIYVAVEDTLMAAKDTYVAVKCIFKAIEILKQLHFCNSCILLLCICGHIS